MIGILLMTHGTLGESLLHCASHILGSRPRQLAQIGVTPQDDPQLILPLAIRLARSVDSGQGILLLTDIFGGTPSNVASRLLLPGKVEGIAGVNLPMLIRLESARKAMSVHAAVTAAREAGRKYISVASEILGEAAA